jgi:hypothetical protein
VAVDAVRQIVLPFGKTRGGFDTVANSIVNSFNS